MQNAVQNLAKQQSRPSAASAAGDGLDNSDGEQPQLATYEDLGAAIEFFLLAAQLLPPEQLQWDVCPYLLLKVSTH